MSPNAGADFATKRVPQTNDDDTCDRRYSARNGREPIAFSAGTFLQVLPGRPPLPSPRIPRQELPRRTLGIAALRCRTCDATMRVLDVMQQTAAIRKILRYLDLPDTPPEVARSRAPPELALGF
ncbi:MAG: hypothetical protein ACO3JL_03590 [Myxococcota bacterium]